VTKQNADGVQGSAGDRRQVYCFVNSPIKITAEGEMSKKVALAGTEDASTQDEEGTGSGGASFQGYLYQAEVTVLVALELLARSATAESISIEPASEEDIEAQIGDELPPAVGLSVDTGKYRLVIQVKHKESGSWGIRSFAKLLTAKRSEHSTRVTPAQRLEDEKIRYLLVTDAGVTGEAAKFQVDDFGVWPSSALPKFLANLVDASSKGRIAILPNLTQRHLRLRARDLLFDALQVPPSKRQACFDALCKEAQRRIVRAHGNRWTRADIKQIVNAFEGHLAGRPELEDYVRPTNWNEMVEQLATKHVVILKGKSGTGKTMTSGALAANLQAGDRRYQAISVALADGPGKVRGYQGPDPVVFEIDDPWGRFKFVESQAEWNEELPRFLRRAGTQRKFIVTTRTDVADEAQVPRELEQFTVTLTPNHYAPQDRASFFKSKLSRLPKEVRNLLRVHREDVITKLPSLYELQKFFDLFASERSSGTALTFNLVHRCTELSSIDVIERTIQDRVRQRSAERLAVVAWALLASRVTVTWELVSSVHFQLLERSERYQGALTNLISSLISSNDLRQVAGQISYVHPRVEAALLGLIIDNSADSGVTCVDVIRSLLSLSEEDSSLVPAAAWLLRQVRVELPQVPIKQDIHLALQGWLADFLLKDERAYARDVIELIASTSAASWPLGKLARSMKISRRHGILSKAQQQQLAEEFTRADTRITPADIDQLRQTEAARQLIELFIKDFLPDSSHHHPKKIFSVLGAVHDDLVPVYLEAAESLIGRDYSGASDAILDGASGDLEGLRRVCLNACRHLESLAFSDEETLASINEETDPMDTYFVGEGLGEMAYVARAIARRYIAERRNSDGWEALSKDAEVLLLRPEWLGVLEDEGGDDSEWATVYKLSVEAQAEDAFWKAFIESEPTEWGTSLARQRMVAPGVPENARLELLRYALKYSPSQIPAVAKELDSDGNVPRLIELAMDFEEVRQATHESQGRPSPDWLEAMSDDSFALMAQLVVPCGPPNWAVDSTATAAILAIGNPTEAIALLQLQLRSKRGTVELADCSQLLAVASTAAVAEAVYWVAEEKFPGQLVEPALHHKFKAVQAAAMLALSRRSPGVPDAVLERSKDLSRITKRALLQAIRESGPQDYALKLLHLCFDESSDEEQRSNGESYPIARSASRLLFGSRGVGISEWDAVLELARDCSDHEVSRNMTALLALQPDADNQMRVVSLIQDRKLHVQQRLEAVEALERNSATLRPEVLQRIGSLELREAPASIGILYGALAATHAPRDFALRLLSELASERRSALLAVAILAVVKGERQSLRDEVLEHLPSGHPALALWSEGSLSLPRDCLDDLGEDDLVDEVLDLFSDSFEPKPQQVRKPMFPRHTRVTPEGAGPL
jgi:hypothetical protein